MLFISMRVHVQLSSRSAARRRTDSCFAVKLWFSHLTIAMSRWRLLSFLWPCKRSLRIYLLVGVSSTTLN